MKGFSESIPPGTRRQQGVHRRVWIGVDTSHVDRCSGSSARVGGATGESRELISPKLESSTLVSDWRSREPGASHRPVLLVQHEPRLDSRSPSWISDRLPVAQNGRPRLESGRAIRWVA